MKAEPVLPMRRIGDWVFDAAAGEVRKGEEMRRLEPRAARALELLCQADGAVVSQGELIERVWNGRTLSENTVPVVIGQLRRALDDDAREPKLIETIPKRGYRLVGANDPAVHRRRPLVLALCLILAAITAFAFFAILASPPAPSIAVADVRNETGNPRFDPLARASGELIVDRLNKEGFSVRRSGDASLVLTTKLVIWDGAPFLGLTATDRDGAIAWSAMLPASPGRVPGGVEKAVKELNARVARSRSRP